MPSKPTLNRSVPFFPGGHSTQVPGRRRVARPRVLGDQLHVGRAVQRADHRILVGGGHAGRCASVCVSVRMRARVRACVCASVAGADVVAPRRVSLLAAVAVDRHRVTPPSAGRGRAPCHRTLQCSRRRHAAPSHCCRRLHSWRSTYGTVRCHASLLRCKRQVAASDETSYDDAVATWASFDAATRAQVSAQS